MEHTVRDIHDILKSYYKVARKRFVDNVCMQGTDCPLVTGPDTPLHVFSPQIIVELSAERLEAVAGEDITSIQQCKSVEKEVEILMEGRRILTTETLETYRVADIMSALFGTIPALRVLQNQLDCNLELQIAMTELKELQNAMQRERPQMWVVIFTAAVIALHVMERDVWRSEYWVLNPETVSLPSCMILCTINNF